MMYTKRALPFVRASAGRVRLLALPVIALITGIVLLALGLLPAGASPDPTPIDDRIIGDACDSLEFSGESIAIGIPSGGGNARVFVQTFELVDEASLTVEVTNDRRELAFSTDGGALVSAVFLFDKTNQRGGALYDYRPPVENDEGPLLASGNSTDRSSIKSITFCYQVPQADLTVSKVADNETPAVGDTVIYTIAVSNTSELSNTDAEDVVVTDELPEGLTFTSASGSQVSEENGVVTWGGTTPIQVPLGDSVELTLTVTVNDDVASGDPVTNTATAASAIDPDSTNNSGVEDILVTTTLQCGSQTGLGAGYAVSIQQCINKSGEEVSVLFSSGTTQAGDPFVLLETVSVEPAGSSALFLEDITFPARAATQTGQQIPFILFHDDTPPTGVGPDVAWGFDAIPTPRCDFNPTLAEDPDVLAATAEDALPFITGTMGPKHTTCFFVASFTQDQSSWVAVYRLLNKDDGWRSGF